MVATCSEVYNKSIIKSLASLSGEPVYSTRVIDFMAKGQKNKRKPKLDKLKILVIYVTGQKKSLYPLVSVAFRNITVPKVTIGCSQSHNALFLKSQ